MMRQKCKQILTISAVLPVLGAALFACLLGLASATAATSSLSREFVVDPLTGVALNGYDPVSYFTEPEPRVGAPEFEYIWRDVSWYFATRANRDVFSRAPAVYAPQFGGYGMTALSRGYLSEGNPRIFIIIGDRLFLFHSTANRDAFMLAPRGAYQKASENWVFLMPGNSVVTPAPSSGN